MQAVVGLGFLHEQMEEQSEHRARSGIFYVYYLCAIGDLRVKYFNENVAIDFIGYLLEFTICIKRTPMFECCYMTVRSHYRILYSTAPLPIASMTTLQ